MALSTPSVTTLALVVVFAFIIHRWRTTSTSGPTANPDFESKLTEAARRLSKELAVALPDSVILPHDTVAFSDSMNFYWAQQECEAVPACVVRPRDVQELSTAVAILKREFDARKSQRKEGKESEGAEGLFAIRSGGRNHIVGAASIVGGVLIDLSLFNKITLSEDGSSVAIGPGTRWKDVYESLERNGLTVLGSRNSTVGVGGYTLGGGISFFSAQFGLTCANMSSYEVVLASGSVVTASASTNPNLWRALKGGSNNFGIVTQFTARTLPSTKIWSGFLYMPSSQAPKVLRAYQEYMARTDSSDPKYDVHAAGPMACFTYLHKLGIQAIAVHMAHTNPPKDEKKWPTSWETTSFKNLWRFWSTCKIRTIPGASEELNATNPPGRRQTFGTTTVKNDLATLEAIHAVYCDAIPEIRRMNIKNMSWTLVLQPLVTTWARKGDPTPLGLDEGPEEPLIIVSLTVNWALGKDDEAVQALTQRAIEKIEGYAAARGTGHRFRFLNYCGPWQKPFESYGEGNLEFLRGVSRKCDPDGLFQKGCVGGFKLGLRDCEA